MEVTRNSETAQRTAPKFWMQIPIQLRRTWAGSNVDRVHHLEENWNFKTKFRTLQLAAATWLEGRLPADIGRVAARCCCCISRSALTCLHYVGGLQFTTAPASSYRVHYACYVGLRL